MNLRRFAFAVCLLSSMGLGLVGRDPLGLVGGEDLDTMTDDNIFCSESNLLGIKQQLEQKSRI